MTDTNGRTFDEAETRDELREVEETLQRLRGEDISRPDGPQDEADRATALIQVEEQDALIANLESRRDRLRARLGEGDATPGQG